MAMLNKKFYEKQVNGNVSTINRNLPMETLTCTMGSYLTGKAVVNVIKNEFDDKSVKKVTVVHKSMKAYQREASWTGNQYRPFFISVLDVVSGKNKSHSLDQILVYARRQNKTLSIFIIDGQQRTIATTLFLSAIKHVLNHFEHYAKQDPTRAMQILKMGEHKFNAKYKRQINKELDKINNYLYNYVSNKHVATNRIFNFPSYDDSKSYHNFKNLYNSFIDDKNSGLYEDNHYTPSKLISSEYHYFINGIAKNIKPCPSFDLKLALLDRFINATVVGLTINLAVTRNYRSGLRLYKNSNTLGTHSLSISAIVKADIGYELGTNLNSGMQKWDRIKDVLNGNQKLMGKYIQNIWTFLQGHVDAKHLLLSINNTITNAKEANHFLNILKSLVKNYFTLVRPNKKHNSFESEDLYQELQVLRKIGFRQYYPLVLVMLYIGKQEQLSEPVLEKHLLIVTKNLVNIYLRHVICSENHTAISQIAHQIYINYKNGKITSLKDIVNTIQNAPVAKSSHLKVVDKPSQVSLNAQSFLHCKTKKGKNATIDNLLLAEAQLDQYGTLTNGNQNMLEVLANKSLVPVQLFTTKNSRISDLDKRKFGNYILLEPSQTTLQFIKHHSATNLRSALKNSSLVSAKNLYMALDNQYKGLNRSNVVNQRTNQFAKHVTANLFKVIK